MNRRSKDQVLRPDICILGGGSAGLSLAAVASQMGADCLLVEEKAMGGDCLNYGCVPSKALLAAGKMATLGRRAGAFGLRYASPEVDFRAVHDHVQGVIAAIAPNDSEERFEGLGVRVLKGHGRFVGPDALNVALNSGGSVRVEARRFVIATGSAPAIPPIPGIEGVDALTNETVFDLAERPARLLVLGGGPVGCELGLAFANLGSQVILIEAERLLPREDPELVGHLRNALRAAGVEILEGQRAAAVARKEGGGLRLTLGGEAKPRALEGDRLLVAAGRHLRLDSLGLGEAGVEVREGHLLLDRRMRTTNRRIFAAGDAAGGPQFTHVASYHAGVLVKNLLFRLPAKVDYRAVPRVTYTRPELAQVGLTEVEARAESRDIRILRWAFAENDRAQCERETEGLVKVVTDPRGRILGAGILGSQAGELILPWVLAIQQKLKIGAMAQVMAPYPTLGEAGKRTAGGFFLDRLFGPRTKPVVRFLSRFG